MRKSHRIGPFMSLVAAALPLACASSPDSAAVGDQPQGESNQAIVLSPVGTSFGDCEMVSTYEAVATDNIIDSITVDSSEFENAIVTVSLFEISETGELIQINRRAQEVSLVDSAAESLIASQSSAAVEQAAEEARSATAVEQLNRAALDSSAHSAFETLDQAEATSAVAERRTTVAERHDVVDGHFGYVGDHVAEDASAERFESATQTSQSAAATSEQLSSLEENSASALEENAALATRSAAIDTTALSEALSQRARSEQSSLVEDNERREAFSKQSHTFNNLESMQLARILVQVAVHGETPAEAVAITAATSERESSTGTFALPVLVCH